MTYRPRHEHRALYYVNQAVWGTPTDGDEAWTVVRENSKSIPQGAHKLRHNLGRAGNGLPYPTAQGAAVTESDYDYSHIQQHGTHQTTHPLTRVLLDDVASLLCQGYNDDNATIANSFHQIPPAIDVTEWASTVVRISAAADADAVYRGQSMMLSGATFNIGTQVGGDPGGQVMATLDWLGEKIMQGVASDGVLETSDEGDGTTKTAVGSKLLTHECSFMIGATDADNLEGFVNATINLRNGLTLLPHSASGLSLGATTGPWDVNGTITVLDQTSALATTTHSQLKDEHDAAVITPLKLRWIWGLDDLVQEIYVYAAILSEGQPSEVGGVTAWTFNWEMCFDGTNAPLGITGGAPDDALWFVDQTP